jgi:hypothetical protein
MIMQDERDRLLADTLALVHSLGHHAAAQSRWRASQARVSASLGRSHADLRGHMQASLNAFRNRQRFLAIEREVNHERAMRRIVSVTEQRA